jgi:hypothetical protein
LKGSHLIDNILIFIAPHHWMFMTKTVNPREYLEAAKKGDLNTVLHYLKEHKNSKAYLNVLTGPEYDELQNTSALGLAAYYNQPVIAKNLLAAGVIQKCQALFNAALNGNLEIVKILLERIGDPQKLSRTYPLRNANGETMDLNLEQIAQRNSHYECATLIRVRRNELENNWRRRIGLFNKPSFSPLPPSLIPPASAPLFISSPIAPQAPPPPYLPQKDMEQVDLRVNYNGASSSCGLFKTIGSLAAVGVTAIGLCAIMSR